LSGFAFLFLFERFYIYALLRMFRVTGSQYAKQLVIEHTKNDARWLGLAVATSALYCSDTKPATV